MTNFLEKINQLDIEISDQQVHRQAAEVAQVIAALDQQQVILKAPESLGFLPDEAEALLKRIGLEKKAAFTVINQLFNSLRQYLSIHYGIWSLPNLATARLIKDQLGISTSLEIMAGNALWSQALNAAGVTVIATDSLEWSKTSKTGQKPRLPVLNLDAPAAIRQFPTVQLIICSWAPNFNESDMQAIAAWHKYNPNAHLLFVGERNGATNSPTFWRKQHFRSGQDLQCINQSFSSFDFIKEQVFEIEYEI